MKETSKTENGQDLTESRGDDSIRPAECTVIEASVSPRRPPIRRDISHELEFTSFTTSRHQRKQPVKPKKSLGNQNDDLLKRAQLHRFFHSSNKRQPTSVAEMTTSENSQTNNAFKEVSKNFTSPPIEKEEAEEEAAIEAERDKVAQRQDALSPSDIRIRILEKEPELMAWRSSEEEERELEKTMERRLNRARKLRRTTVMHYDQQEDTFRRRRAPQLFEVAVLIDLDENDGSNEKLYPLDTYNYVPKISFVYPCKTPQSLQPLLVTLPPLCYADLGRARPENPERYKDEQFLMIITDTSGDRKYAYCHRFAPFDPSKYTVSTDHSNQSQSGSSTIGRNNTQSEKVLPRILCIVTPVNAAPFYFDLAHEAALRAKSGNVQMLTTFLTQSFRHRLPAANGFITVKLVDDDNPEEGDEDEEGADTGWEVVLVNRTSPKKGQGLGELLDRLGVDRLIKLFCALLCEKRVLLIADSLPLLSRSVQAVSTMLAPFEWPHTLIPVIPDPFLHLCFSPAPYLMGVLRDHIQSLRPLLQDDKDVENQEEYMLILDIDKALILKDREWATTNSSTGALDFASSTPKLLPNRITRSLKDLLKTAMKCNATTERREQKTMDAFQWTFVELVGHYRDHLDLNGVAKFNRESFINASSSRSQRNFLKWFVETGMFQVWINKKIDTIVSGDPKQITTDVFDKKLDQLKAAASDSRSWPWRF